VTFIRGSATPLLFAVGLALPAAVAGQPTPQEASSTAGAVATDHPLATLAAIRVLEDGGNAADAAVAAAFTLAVVLPSTNSIGGRNQILVRESDGTVRVIDGTTQVPAEYDPGRARSASAGYSTVGVPGAVAGLMRLHREHGTRPLGGLMAFAIAHAAEGFQLTPQEAEYQRLAAGDLRRSEGAARSFLHPDGSTYRAGELLVQPDLAETLRAIAGDGGESFYRGEIAQRMSADILAKGGYVGAADLARYEALDGRVVRGSYRGYDLVGAGIPAAGAISIEALQILETFEPDDYTPGAWAAIIGQAVSLASGELQGLGSDSAAARTTSKEWAAVRARLISDGTVGSAGLGDSSPPHWDVHTEALARSGHTTHLSVVDPDGMAVALTQTVGPTMGARVATPGLGFLYAVTLGGYLGGISPGERARSFISPLMVLENGEPVMVIGAAGGARIVSSVVQVISRVIDEGRALAEALSDPRVFMTFGGELEMETSGPRPWSESEMAGARTLGLEVDPVGRRGAFGFVQALWRDVETGVWTAAAEPDGEGAAGGVREP